MGREIQDRNKNLSVLPKDFHHLSDGVLGLCDGQTITRHDDDAVSRGQLIDNALMKESKTVHKNRKSDGKGSAKNAICN
jgi:hypothetical protein